MKPWNLWKSPTQGMRTDIEMHVPDDIEMEGDKDRLRQLFTNIIANALKHSADNTKVLIEAA